MWGFDITPQLDTTFVPLLSLRLDFINLSLFSFFNYNYRALINNFSCIESSKVRSGENQIES